MSMKWVGFPNHNLQHIASEKLRDSPMTATVHLSTVTVRPSIYQVGVASLCPLATLQGAKTHNLCILRT